MTKTSVNLSNSRTPRAWVDEEFGRPQVDDQAAHHREFLLNAWDELSRFWTCDWFIVKEQSFSQSMLYCDVCASRLPGTGQNLMFLAVEPIATTDHQGDSRGAKFAAQNDVL
ncbi:hypothetical protein RRG08_015742 [Elysia crispata]|uniref:Uncharacterized protein n=1 Tax=Elysia crispata TaxID=231223 RepID=A0AAE0YTH2_9GAST|nr:hypothetical protein RRG08_015742 [Elysia crispata]